MAEVHESQSMQVDTAAITAWAQRCAEAAGAAPEVAQSIAKYLVEADLMGFRTHGLVRLRYNLECLQDGRSKQQGDIQVIRERAAVANWDAELLSGLYVVPQAIQKAIEQARACGTGTVVIRRAQHVAALAAYLTLATDQNMLISLMASTPGQQAVAPFGAKSAVFSPNPFAIGVPTQTTPILLDVSLSMTAAGKVRQAIAEKRDLPFAGLITADGQYTKEAATFLADPPSVLATLGGADLGYKGSGLTLFSELWTMALSQYGRAEGVADADANSVWVQVIDPTAFGELDSFLAQSQAQVDALKAATPIDPAQPVRVPGESAQRLKREQLRDGVHYSAAVWRQLVHCEKLTGVALPDHLG